MAERTPDPDEQTSTTTSDPITNTRFHLKFCSKQLQRRSKRSEKAMKTEKLKCKKSLLKGNEEGARIYAENVVRLKAAALDDLRLSSRIDAVASRWNSLVTLKQKVTLSCNALSTIDKALLTADNNKIGKVLSTLEHQLCNVSTVHRCCCSCFDNSHDYENMLPAPCTPLDLVGDLLAELRSELNMDPQLPLVVAGPAAVSPACDLESRLAKLRAA
eukprot:TRINITY_DN67341_c0_g1_i2.p1 TRINITY_DN67341_c0_g1~~TRINITY_DN67341_c0_g1_i2.p1  ORF type:complete len:216 (+),score=26.17 TRINITY_DN67341_c0_g1_i2:49-696(+)